MYEVIHHTETTSPHSWVVFWRRGSKLERALHVGRRGGFRSEAEARQAIERLTRFGSLTV